MPILEPSIFELIFTQSLAPTIVFRANAPEFSVLSINAAYQQAMNVLESDWVGRPADELLAADADDIELQESYALLAQALNQAIGQKVIVKLPAIKSPVRDTAGLPKQIVWRQMEVVPVLDGSGNVQYLVCPSYDVSKFILLEDARAAGVVKEYDLTEELAASNEELSASNEELSAANEELRQSQKDLHESNRELENRIKQRTHALAESESRFRAMVEQSPVPMLVTMGDAVIFDIINQPMLNLIGKDASVIGMPWHDAMPELEGQDVIKQLLETYDSGVSWEGSEVPIMVHKNGEPILGFYNITYKPLIENGKTIGMLHSAIDVSDVVKARLLVEGLNREQQASNEELSAMNEELAAMNEEMAATNEELQASNNELMVTQHSLQTAVVDLAASEQQLEQVISILPASVVVIKGDDLIVESINNANLAYWNKSATEVLGKPFLKILPDLADQPFARQLRHVMATGEIIDVKESPVLFTEADGTQRETFVDYTYQPLADSDGTYPRVLVMSFEITDKVRSRKLLEQYSDEMQRMNEELTAANEELFTAQKAVEESRTALQLAIDAAEFGTWFIHSETREFISDARLKEFFGYYADEGLSIEQALAQIREDYREIVTKALDNAIYHNGDYDISYPVIGLHDNRLRWLRAKGNLKADPSGEFSAFTGVVMDITEQKTDEIRKNDFIGMVSHELKTPLTSLNGYLQMLQMRAKKGEDAFTVNALDQSVKQVKRMTTMINGFLNVSRLDSAKIHIEKQRFDMAALVKEMAEETMSLYSNHHFVFHTVEPTLVNADRDKIGQVINNFISNAVKYSQTSSTIQISCIQGDGFTWVSVADEGMGIDKAEISRLFERYYRVNNHTNISGFGIGLYLSAEIIERHQGKIWAESEPGEGSTFYFSLPLAL